MSNRSNGTAFEAELCQILSEHGFWAHNLAQKASGQPFDVIASRNHMTFVIDCKVCEGDDFRLSRVEENQERAMTRWWERGNGDGWFALRMSDGEIYMVALQALQWLRDNMGRKHIGREIIETNGWPLEKWVYRCA